MNSEKLERLKKVLSGTEFEVEATSIYSALIKLKDIWEGVEFCKSKWIDSIHPINNVSKIAIGERYTPSTEEAYVNQLKAKAFGLYGEIQDQDGFKEPDGNTDTYREKGSKVNPKWDYVKHQDELFFYSILLYKNGQWAKKLPKRIEVNFDGGNVEAKGFYFIYDNTTTEKMINIGCPKIGEFLANQLEEYLNDEVD